MVTIVLNGEQTLPSSIKSVKALTVPYEHIIGVDDRSTDKTLEIARAATPHHYTFAWPDSFSAACNMGFAKATGDYVLRLDADERLVRPDIIDLLVTHPQYAHFNGFGFNTVQCRKDGTVTGESPTLTRLVKRDMGYRYRGRIHEQLYIGDDPTSVDNTYGTISDRTIVHYGYDTALLDEKVERNNRLAAMDAWDDNNPMGLYHLARTYTFSGDYTEGRRYALLALSESHRLPAPVADHCLELAQMEDDHGPTD